VKLHAFELPIVDIWTKVEFSLQFRYFAAINKMGLNQLCIMSHNKLYQQVLRLLAICLAWVTQTL